MKTLMAILMMGSVSTAFAGGTDAAVQSQTVLTLKSQPQEIGGVKVYKEALQEEEREEADRQPWKRVSWRSEKEFDVPEAEFIARQIELATVRGGGNVDVILAGVQGDQHEKIQTLIRRAFQKYMNDDDLDRLKDKLEIRMDRLVGGIAKGSKPKEASSDSSGQGKSVTKRLRLRGGKVIVNVITREDHGNTTTVDVNGKSSRVEAVARHVVPLQDSYLNRNVKLVFQADAQRNKDGQMLNGLETNKKTAYRVGAFISLDFY